MKVLITGIDGFVGRWLAAHLLERGDEVHGTHRPGRDPALPATLAGRVRLHPLDVVERSACRAVVEEVRAAWCFHLAAVSRPTDSARDPGRALAVNVLGSWQVADAFGRAGGASLVFPSSVHVYGPPRAERVDEEHPLDPGGPYGVSKLAAEALVLAAARTHGFRASVLRLFNQTGPGQAADFVVPALARRLAACRRRGGTCRVGDLDVERDFLDVRDAVRAYRLVAERGSGGEVFNVGSGRAVSLREIYAMLARRLGTAAEAEVDPALLRPGEVRRFVAEVRRLHQRTGWEPSIPLETTLAELAAEAEDEAASS